MELFPETRESLLLRVKSPRDAEAWEEFLGIYRPAVVAMARNRGLQDADAADIAQQVFLSVAQALDGWQPDENGPPFRAWLATIARNAILKALARRRPDRGTGSTSTIDLLNQQPEPEPELARELALEARRQMFRWVAEEIRPEFSAATWSLFWETAVENRAIEAVAAETGRSPGAVYMARWRVMQRMKERVGEFTESWSE